MRKSRTKSIVLFPYNAIIFKLLVNFKARKCVTDFIGFGLIYAVAIFLLDPLETGLEICQTMEVLIIA